MTGGIAPAREADGAEAFHVRLVTLTRALLALAALAFSIAGAGGVAQFDQRIYVLLMGYVLYSGLLAGAALSGHPLARLQAEHWVDVAVFGALVMFSAGASNLFFLLFFFPILVVSFSRGCAAGLAVTVVSAGLVAVVSLAALARPEIDLLEALARPVELLVLGSMMACLGGREFAQRRRLELLREVAGLVNPRVGLDHAISRSLRCLREFFGARDCVLVCLRGPSREHVMYRVDAANPHRAPVALTEEARQVLLAIEPDAALVWRAGGAADEPLRRIASLLDAESFATVPFRQRDGMDGRLYVTSGRAASAELAFLRQIVEQIAAAVDNLAIIEQVMKNAAKLERARISRDIHDTTLQPYIGLLLGLEALARKLEPGTPQALQAAELLAVSSQVIADLRSYVARLRDEDEGWPAEHLLSGLREHLGRYRSFYGIDIELRSDASMQVTDRVAGEAYQIVCEALSNIHRHTPSKRAFVDLRCKDEHLSIEVGNERSADAATSEFIPRSITERVAALGGRAEVQLQDRGHDVVRVAIPL